MPGRRRRTHLWKLAPLLLLLWLPPTAWAQTADPGALVLLPGDDAGSATCGDVVVSWDSERSFDVANPGSVSVRATTPDGQAVFELARPLAAGERVLPLWCGDVVGDGSQALAFTFFSGGAHCCFSTTLVALDADGRHLLDADLGNGGLAMPAQLDVAGSLELPATSDVFAYFDDLSFAASPFLPLVFAYDGTAYVEATRQFPDRLRSQVRQAEADLADAVARPVPADEPAKVVCQEQESVALRLFGLDVLLGDADQTMPSLEATVAPPVVAWLEANSAAARDAIARRYDLSDSR